MNKASAVAPQDTADKPVTGPFTGNEAIARGVWEAGVKVAAAYPGTPSTEIMENVAKYPAEDLHAQWSTNEKTALDTAIGGSFAGVRSFAAMKHVGMNVASDALMSFSYIGVNAGLVVLVCDDPGIHSSQNEQDTRVFAGFAQVPVIEPSDGQEALDFTKYAFDLSEKFETPVIVRATTRLSHTRSEVKVGARVEPDDKGFDENPSKNVMVPMNARRQHPVVLKRTDEIAVELAEGPLTQVEIQGGKLGGKVGVITMAMSYVYVKEVMGDVSVLKLAGSYPLSESHIRKFTDQFERIIVVEELEPVVENALKIMGIAVEGKSLFPRIGEFSPEIVREGFVKAGLLEEKKHKGAFDLAPMARPPVLCSGCPHTSCYMALRALDARVAGDIGCYTLAVAQPLEAIDTCVSMGSSIANAVGMAKAGTETKPIIATIGDSTFLHSGIPPLIDAVYNNANITVFLLDNHITAMTGGQEHPGTGITLRGEKTAKVDYTQLIKALGVEWVETVDSYDMASMYQSLREAVEFKGVSVVISDRPCVLDPVKIKGQAFTVDQEKCVACQSCMNLGCPALTWSEGWYEGRHKVEIDPQSCMGCSICAQICPTDSIAL